MIDGNEPEIIALAMIAEVVDEPEVYAGFAADEMVLDQALMAGNDNDEQKAWIIDSGCSSHFSLNKSEFVC